MSKLFGGRGGVGSRAAPEPWPLLICFVNGVTGGGGAHSWNSFIWVGSFSSDFQDVGNGR